MSAHTYKHQTSDFFLGTVLIVSILFELLIPSTFSLARLWLIISGLCFWIFAFTIILITKRQFIKFRQKRSPQHETTVLMQSGIFSYSRNPIYLGVSIMPLAFGLIFDSVWIAFSSMVLVALMHFYLVLPEEKYLEKVFGQKYLEYKRKVRRWF